MNTQQIKKYKQASFTLVELLVVIAIIGILAAAVIFGVKRSADKSRDARRLEDMQNIIKALHAFYLDYGHYPGSTDEGIRPGGEFIGIKAIIDPDDKESNHIDDLLKPYLPKVPRDPQHNPAGTIYTSSDADKYFYAYDPQHCTMTGGPFKGESVAEVSINKWSETGRAVDRENDCGGDVNQNNAAYNRVLYPAGP